MKTNRMTKVVVLTAALLALSAPITAGAQCGDQGNWTPLNFPYSGGALDVPLLLTDGRVMVQYVGNGAGSHPLSRLVGFNARPTPSRVLHGWQSDMQCTMERVGLTLQCMAASNLLSVRSVRLRFRCACERTRSHSGWGRRSTL